MSTRSVSFEVLAVPPHHMDEARLGKLSCLGRREIETPSHVALSARGAVPHLSQDTVQNHTAIRGIHMALEDFVERAADKVPPVLQIPVDAHESRLRKFTATHQDSILILGPRHVPSLPCPTANTHSAVSIVTSIGFSALESAYYAEAIHKLKPDIALSMADVVDSKPGVKRKEKMGDRTQTWLKDLIAATEDSGENASGTAVFAPVLPIEAEEQSYYLDALDDDFAGRISGLVLYNTTSVLSIPDGLSYLPRMLTTDSRNPHKLLEAVAAGVDLFAVPFVGAATDAGIALDFSFAVQEPEPSNRILPLGIDMWSVAHHRAYVQHLLSAKEMLGWVLLQIHNHHIVDNFFAEIRQSIRYGSFHKDKESFGQRYEPELPEKTGQGPRIRGYQYKSEGGGELPKNTLAYRSLDDVEKLAEAPVPGPSIDAKDLEQQGFAEREEP
ncbi:MAG: hypothetical protein Q9195_002105 [Heterodermia aff. obscurata]